MMSILRHCCFAILLTFSSTAVVITASFGGPALSHILRPFRSIMDNLSYQVGNQLLQEHRMVDSSLVNALLRRLIIGKYAPTTTSDINTEYDFIIVGAGSAGSTVAGRLSEVPCVNVLLLEAGGDPPLLTEIPPGGLLFLGTDVDWNYRTVPQNHTGAGLKNRAVHFPSGKVIGGTSVINGNLCVRGNRKNYDAWAANGATGWSYKDVLPYFKKMERNTNAKFVDRGYHGFSGPVTVMHPGYRSSMRRAVLEASRSLGYSVLDSNGRQQNGFYDIQATMRNGRRCSTAKAYLVPADSRPNLDIVKNAFVKKVLIERGRAVGVLFDFEGEAREVRATKEVILSAGTLNTPKVLMLSGIGPKEELQKFKIPVVADLPVGLNFHDHCAAVLGYEMSKVTPYAQKIFDPIEISKYITSRSGPLASASTIGVLAFLNKNRNASARTLPDFELYFTEADNNIVRKVTSLTDEVYDRVFAPHDGESQLLCASQQLNTRSRGSIKLKSADPYDPPLIDPNYLAHPDDLKDIVAGLRQCNVVARQEAMRSIGVKRWTEKYPGCERFSLDSDDAFECQVKSTISSSWHPAGSAKMGSASDPTTVVDPQLRVKGIGGLRVVDASIMPQVTSGNTNVPTIMIAEKASDMIKATLSTCRNNQD